MIPTSGLERKISADNTSIQSKSPKISHQGARGDISETYSHPSRLSTQLSSRTSNTKQPKKIYKGALSQAIPHPHHHSIQHSSLLIPSTQKTQHPTPVYQNAPQNLPLLIPHPSLRIPLPPRRETHRRIRGASRPALRHPIYTP